MPLAPSGRGPGEGLGALGLLLLGMAMGSAVWMYKRNPRWALSFAVLMLIALGGAACSSLPKGPNGATPPGRLHSDVQRHSERHHHHDATYSLHCAVASRCTEGFW